MHCTQMFLANLINTFQRNNDNANKIKLNIRTTPQNYHYNRNKQHYMVLIMKNEINVINKTNKSDKNRFTNYQHHKYKTKQCEVLATVQNALIRKALMVVPNM